MGVNRVPHTMLSDDLGPARPDGGGKVRPTEANTTARAAWQACREQNRCSRGLVGVTGADIVRISRTLAVEPRHFTQTAPAAVDDPGGIVVDKGRRRVTLTLASAAHGCVFLVKPAGGASCCGLGDVAPVSCRLFPQDPATGGQMTERPDEDLDGWAADQAHWYETVARWNRQFAAASAAATGIEDFQRYLLEAQAAREAGTEWPEEVTA